MSVVFADSFYFLALLNTDDPAHEVALQANGVQAQNLVLTDCVLLELGDALCDPRDRDDFLQLYHFLTTDPTVKIVPITSNLLIRAIQLFRARPDKDWPLTDCISFTVMEEQGIQEALTGDRHFEQAGFTALLM